MGAATEVARGGSTVFQELAEVVAAKRQVDAVDLRDTEATQMPCGSLGDGSDRHDAGARAVGQHTVQVGVVQAVDVQAIDLDSCTFGVFTMPDDDDRPRWGEVEASWLGRDKAIDIASRHAALSLLAASLRIAALDGARAVEQGDRQGSTAAQGAGGPEASAAVKSGLLFSYDPAANG